MWVSTMTTGRTSWHRAAGMAAAIVGRYCSRCCLAAPGGRQSIGFSYDFGSYIVALRCRSDGGNRQTSPLLGGLRCSEDLMAAEAASRH